MITLVNCVARVNSSFMVVRCKLVGQKIIYRWFTIGSRQQINLLTTESKGGDNKQCIKGLIQIVWLSSCVTTATAGTS